MFFVRWHPDFNFFFSRPKIAKKNENFCCKFHRVSNGTGESGVEGGHFGGGVFWNNIEENNLYSGHSFFVWDVFHSLCFFINYSAFIHSVATKQSIITQLFFREFQWALLCCMKIFILSFHFHSRRWEGFLNYTSVILNSTLNYTHWNIENTHALKVEL